MHKIVKSLQQQGAKLQEQSAKLQEAGLHFLASAGPEDRVGLIGWVKFSVLDLGPVSPGVCWPVSGYCFSSSTLPEVQSG